MLRRFDRKELSCVVVVAETEFGKVDGAEHAESRGDSEGYGTKAGVGVGVSEGTHSCAMPTDAFERAGWH